MMTTRRDWMTQTSVVAVGATLGFRVLSDLGQPAAAGAVSGAQARAAASVQAPAPWALFAPLQVGSSIGNGWSIESLSDVRLGASVLSLRHESGAKSDVHICLRQGQSQGVVSTRHFDFVLMNEADGGVPTNEALGVALITLARRADANDVAVSRTGFMSHADRLSQYGWDQIA